MKTTINEKFVTQAWQSLINSVYDFSTENGESLKIIYPGKTSDAPGSDYQDAVITLDGTLIRGNIEVHVSSRDWRTHRHHRDSAYNGVVLHVVMWHDTPGNTELANGRKIPVIALNRYFDTGQNRTGSPSSRLSVPCSGIGEYYPDKVVEILEQSGNLRFYEKAAQIEVELQDSSGEQSLYQGIMGALGYSRNITPFRELARRVPLSELESITKGNGSDEEKLLLQQSLLIGNAGFLPSQRQGVVSDNYEVAKIESAWEIMSHSSRMSVSDWQVFRVRPSNSPIRRIVGMSHLILRYREKGLFIGLVELVREAPMEKGYKWLADGLMVECDGYWANHFDFGRQCRNISPLLIGRSRADDIIINVLLPFTYVWAKNNKHIELSDKSLELYCSYAAISPNTIEKHMRRQLGLKNKQANSARQQQGLLHIYKKWCTQGMCEQCPVSYTSFKLGMTSRDKSLVLPD